MEDDVMEHQKPKLTDHEKRVVETTLAWLDEDSTIWSADLRGVKTKDARGWGVEFHDPRAVQFSTQALITRAAHKLRPKYIYDGLGTWWHDAGYVMGDLVVKLAAKKGITVHQALSFKQLEELTAFLREGLED